MIIKGKICGQGILLSATHKFQPRLALPSYASSFVVTANNRAVSHAITRKSSSIIAYRIPVDKMDESEARKNLSPADLPSTLAHRSLVESEVAKPAEANPEGPKPPKDPKGSKDSKDHPKKGKGTGKAGMPSHVNSDANEGVAAVNKPAMSSLPEYITERNKLFDELKRRQDEELLQRDHHEINVVIDLGRGNERAVIAKAWESTPVSFLKDLKGEVAPDIVVAKVDGKELWDLDRPLERNCRLSYVPFGSPEGRHVFWHSSAHVLGEAAECHYPKCLLSHGPPVDQGFFYDMALEQE